MDYKSEIKANEACDRIVEELRKATGLPWGKRVWENLGWHCSAILKSDVGSFSVSENYGCTRDTRNIKTYSAYASPDGQGGHSAYLGDVPRGATPVEAFDGALRQLKTQYNKIRSFYEFATTRYIECSDEGLKRIFSGEVKTIKNENGTVIGFTNYAK